MFDVKDVVLNKIHLLYGLLIFFIHIGRFSLSGCSKYMNLRKETIKLSATFLKIIPKIQNILLKTKYIEN